MTTPLVTLTFDNGPTPGVTEPVLDMLAVHSVRATFFAIGRKLATTEGLALGRRIVRAGHQLGGHTWSHSVQFGRADDATVDSELVRTRAVVDEVGGNGLLFRPYGAGGVIDDRLMSAFGATTLQALDYTCVLWNVLPGDWRDQPGWVDQALNEIDNHAWSVVVLHDVVDAALPRLDEFLTAAALRKPKWSQEFPDDCTPIRNGSATPAYATLCLTD
jgi:peptidoglycan-N-acetylglucosamine deacetylase